jgi:hypothetical protein
MSKADTLLLKLKSSLPKPATLPLNKSQSATREHSPNGYSSSPAHATPTVSETGQVVVGINRPKSVRVPLCFSVYESDMQRLDEIKEFMRGKGYRNVTSSEALRLACRAVEVGDQFVAVYEQMRREDGRRK